MRQLATSAALAITALLNSGCAYLTTYTKPIDLDTNSYALDVKQRVVVSQEAPPIPGSTHRRRVTCAEPSPDALTVIGVTGGLSVSADRKAGTTGTANTGVSLSESGAYIGLRTTSIQLLRDVMYRLCEGYAAGAVNEQTFQSMQRRYQSTMMGLIAIEQLTGPVVAAQAALTTAAASQSGAPVGDATAAKAQERVDTSNQKVLDAKATLDTSTARVSTAASAATRIDAESKAEAAKKEPDATKSQQLAEDAKATSEELEAAKLQRDANARSLRLAEDQARSAAAELRAAQARVATYASGSATVGEVSRAMADTSQHLTEGVVKIVAEINASYLRDSCFGFSADLLRDPDLIGKLRTHDAPGEEAHQVSPVRMVRALINSCQAVLVLDATRLAKGSGASNEQIQETLRNVPRQ